MYHQCTVGNLERCAIRSGIWATERSELNSRCIISYSYKGHGNSCTTCKSPTSSWSDFSSPRCDYNLRIYQSPTDAVTAIVRLILCKPGDEDGRTSALSTDTLASRGYSGASFGIGFIQQSAEGR
jgi:hypothetical protein